MAAGVLRHDIAREAPTGLLWHALQQHARWMHDTGRHAQHTSALSMNETSAGRLATPLQFVASTVTCPRWKVYGIMRNAGAAVAQQFVEADGSFT